jgi:uncharacterized membrane protein
MPTLYTQIAGRSLERIAALSDGLFAIAMTLLVLDVRVPAMEAIHSEADLWHALVALSPRFITFLMSFLTLGIFWSAQQTQLNYTARADRDLAWLNIAFLAAISLMPFSTMLLAEFITFRLAVVVYWLNLLLLGFFLYATWAYAERAGLVKEDTSAEVSAALKRRIVIYQLLYVVGALLCLISPYWSIAFIFLLQLSSAVAPRIPRLRRA